MVFPNRVIPSSCERIGPVAFFCVLVVRLLEHKVCVGKFCIACFHGWLILT